jgi:hypothetical protein
LPIMGGHDFFCIARSEDERGPVLCSCVITAADGRLSTPVFATSDQLSSREIVGMATLFTLPCYRRPRGHGTMCRVQFLADDAKSPKHRSRAVAQTVLTWPPRTMVGELASPLPFCTGKIQTEHTTTRGPTAPFCQNMLYIRFGQSQTL